MTVSVSDKKYITLLEANKLCCYSQDYLSLRARQGKLRAIKLGRNWVTTEEWLKEYIASFASQTSLSQVQPRETEGLSKKPEALEIEDSALGEVDFVKTLPKPEPRRISRLFFVVIAVATFLILVSQNISGFSQFFLNKFDQIKSITGSLTRELVKETAEDKAKKELEQAFSDEIAVEEVDESGNSGVFVPVFAGSKGSKYLFRKGFTIVPLREE